MTAVQLSSGYLVVVHDVSAITKYHGIVTSDYHLIKWEQQYKTVAGSFHAKMMVGKYKQVELYV